MNHKSSFLLGMIVWVLCIQTQASNRIKFEPNLGITEKKSSIAISPEEFFQYRMSNKKHSRQEFNNWEVVAKDSQFVYLGKPIGLKGLRYVEKLYRADLNMLTKLFPGYAEWEGYHVNDAVYAAILPNLKEDYFKYLLPAYNWSVESSLTSEGIKGNISYKTSKSLRKNQRFLFEVILDPENLNVIKVTDLSTAKKNKLRASDQASTR